MDQSAQQGPAHVAGANASQLDVFHLEVPRKEIA
jgi:hypothetical protein